jgi:general secretion pathway protein I
MKRSIRNSFCINRAAKPSTDRRGDRQCRRRGITLLEVLLAAVILAGSLAALGQLVSNGVNAGLRAEMQTEATLRCQSKLDELLAGVEELRPISGAEFSDDRRWTWALEIDVMSERLRRVTVAVHRDAGQNSADFALTRLIRQSVGVTGRAT